MAVQNFEAPPESSRSLDARQTVCAGEYEYALLQADSRIQVSSRTPKIPQMVGNQSWAGFEVAGNSLVRKSVLLVNAELL